MFVIAQYYIYIDQSIGREFHYFTATALSKQDPITLHRLYLLKYFVTFCKSTEASGVFRFEPQRVRWSGMQSDLFTALIDHLLGQSFKQSPGPACSSQNVMLLTGAVRLMFCINCYCLTLRHDY